MHRRCRCCGSSKSDPVSILCLRCYKTYKRHGSPHCLKPSLKRELKQSKEILSRYETKPASKVFDDWMMDYADPSSKDPLRRLCGLHFKALRQSDDSPLMTFEHALGQALAVTTYQDQGGATDDERKQLQYLLGRASVSVWNRARKSKATTVYDGEDRKELQRRPKLFHRAFHEVFIRGGIGRFLARLRTNERKEIATWTENR